MNVAEIRRVVIGDDRMFPQKANYCLRPSTQKSQSALEITCTKGCVKINPRSRNLWRFFCQSHLARRTDVGLLPGGEFIRPRRGRRRPGRRLHAHDSREDRKRFQISKSSKLVLSTSTAKNFFSNPLRTPKTLLNLHECYFLNAFTQGLPRVREVTMKI